VLRSTTGRPVGDRQRHVHGDRISAFLDDELGNELALEVTRHLASCDECLDELEQLRATRDALRRLPGIQAPRPMLTTAAVGPHRTLLGRVSKRLQFASVAMVLVIGIFGIAYLAGEDRGDVVPPIDLFLVDHVARTGGGPVPAPFGLAGR
jgi:anti-sigma factor RsiW